MIRWTNEGRLSLSFPSFLSPFVLPLVTLLAFCPRVRFPHPNKDHLGNIYSPVSTGSKEFIFDNYLFGSSYHLALQFRYPTNRQQAHVTIACIEAGPTRRLNHWYTAVYNGLEFLRRRLEEWELVRCQVRLIVNNTLLYSAIRASLGKPCIPTLLVEQRFLFCPRFCAHEELASGWFVYRRYGVGDMFKMDS